MHSKVVHTVYRVLDGTGHPTLRFNFRGVGASRGAMLERRDRRPRHGCRLARARTGGEPSGSPGFLRAWIALRLGAESAVERCIALVAAKGTRSTSSSAPAPLLIVQGERDHIR
jgi:alpha/beta superfamily hydrolase